SGASFTSADPVDDGRFPGGATNDISARDVLLSSVPGLFSSGQSVIDPAGFLHPLRRHPVAAARGSRTAGHITDGNTVDDDRRNGRADEILQRASWCGAGRDMDPSG